MRLVQNLVCIIAMILLSCALVAKPLKFVPMMKEHDLLRLFYLTEAQKPYALNCNQEINALDYLDPNSKEKKIEVPLSWIDDLDACTRYSLLWESGRRHHTLVSNNYLFENFHATAVRTIDDPIYGSKSIEESAKTTRVFSKKVKEIAKQCNEKYGRPAGSAHTPWQQKEKMIKDWMHEVSSCINSKQSEIKANIHLDDQSRIISMDEHNCREWQKSYKLSEDQLRDQKELLAKEREYKRKHHCKWKDGYTYCYLADSNQTGHSAEYIYEHSPDAKQFKLYSTTNTPEYERCKKDYGIQIGPEPRLK
ncbi:hypothetical protein [Helicobacter suis]|nr:hypothetical protein [Helicobacter suis]